MLRSRSIMIDLSLAIVLHQSDLAIINEAFFHTHKPRQKNFHHVLILAEKWMNESKWHGEEGSSKAGISKLCKKAGNAEMERA